MNPFRIVSLVLLCTIGQLVGVCRLGAEDPAPIAPRFSPEEQQQREAVLKSQEWVDTKSRIEKWLSVQSTYTPAQVEQMKREFASRIDSMSPTELAAFGVEMQQRLDVLLSPQFNAVRSWADGLYTTKGKQELVQEYHLTDPLSMSPEQLTDALDQFESDRQSNASAQAAFLRSQTAQSQAVAQQERQQASAAARTPQKAGSYPKPNISPRSTTPQRYPGPNYRIGPWGGVWRGF